MPHNLTVASQISFLYFKDLTPAIHFFEQIMGLELVEDQQWAKIYRLSGNAFIGAVDEARGHLNAQPHSAVLTTFVVDDVPAWYDHLRQQPGITIEKELATSAEIQVQYFFFEGPGGYKFEVQKFQKPHLAEIFGLTI